MVSSARKKEAKTIWIPRPRPVARSAVSYTRPSVPKPSSAHSAPTAKSPAKREEDERAAGEQAVLELQPPAEPLEQRIVLADPHARVGAREDAELDHLRADQRERDEAEHRVDLPRAAEDVHRAGREREHADEPEEQHRGAGTRYSQLGLYRSMKRTCRQASPKRLSFDSPTRG